MRRVPLAASFALGLLSCHRPAGPETVRVAELTRPTPPPRRLAQPIDPRVREGRPLALARFEGSGARYAVVADEDEDAVHLLDLDRGTTARTPLPGAPTSILVLPDGTLAVALRRAATVLLLEAREAPGGAKHLDPVASLPTADEPVGLALSPDGATLAVVSGWGRELETFALATRARTRAVSLGREPRAVTITDDGRIWVGYAATSALESVDPSSGVATTHSLTIGGTTTVISSKNFMPSFDAFSTPGSPADHVIRTPPRFARQTFALVRSAKAAGDKELVLAPHQLVSAGETQAVTSGYGVSMEDTSPMAFGLAAAGASVARGELPMGCRLPRGAALDVDGSLLVACLGEDAVIGVRVRRDAPTKAGLALSVVKRLPLPGGPLAVAVDPARGDVVTLAAFDRRVHVHDRFGVRVAVLDLEHVPGLGLSADAAEGRRIFHAATEPQVSKDGRACASCHPEGRDDGVTWPTPRGPRQTVFLAGRLTRPAPYGWDAEHASLQAHVTVTMKNLGGTGLAPRRLDALAAWLAEMPPPPRRRSAGALEKEGAAIFASAKAGCAGCHVVETLHTDGQAHEVASKTHADASAAFLAPSLRFVGGSAPYFHDGRYPTLGELLRASDGTMGETAHLGQGELAALEAYLRSL